MKKHTTLFALGTLICSQVLPIAAHANNLDQASNVNSDSPPISNVINPNDDSDFEEDVAATPETEVISEEEESSSKLEADSIIDTTNSTIDSQSESSLKTEVQTLSNLVWSDESGNTIDMEFDHETGVLTIGGGSLIDPQSLGDAIGDEISNDVKIIQITDSIILSGSISSMFNGVNYVEEIKGLPNINTSGVTNMAALFGGLSNVTNLEISSWDTSNVEDMELLFYNCENLVGVDISKWETKNVKNMTGMFYHCESLTHIDLSNWNTNNVERVYTMFIFCSNLKTVDLSNWDTKNLFDMGKMFYECHSLEKVDLSNWNTQNVYMSSLFYNCVSLKELVLGSEFDFVSTEVELPNINNDNVYTGYWEKVGDSEHPLWTSEELMTTYIGATDAGTYVWQKIDGTDVTVNYVDTDGKTIADSVTLSGKIEDAYTSEQKEIKGYTFKEVEGNTTGVFTSEAQTVTYVYSKDIAPVTSNVEVKYVDEAGNMISDTITLTGEIGTSYTSEKVAIKGYTFKEVKGNATGKFNENVQTVTYIYSKNKEAGVTTPTNHNSTNLPTTGTHDSISSILIGSAFAALAAVLYATRLKRRK